jgi:NAD+ diphosphatase
MGNELIIKDGKVAYIFKGDSIVVPDDIPDSLLHGEINCDLINSSFFAVKDLDCYTIPPLAEADSIRVITLPDGELPSGWKALSLRQALPLITGGTIAEASGIAGGILRSFHVSQWRKESRFCGSCGAANRDAENGELARQCPRCGRLEFPRVAPAVIIIVTNDKDQALLAHNKKFSSGVYSIVAGFNEAGESLEDTVMREIKEEVNLEVKDIRYVRSQPWPFPNSLMLGFSARYSGGELRPDGVEIEDVRWFSRDALPSLPGSASISRYLINLWLEGKLPS